MIRWAIIGAGRIANDFAKALSLFENCTITIAVANTQKSAQQFSEIHNVKWYGVNYKDAYILQNADAIYVATPHVFHFAITKHFLENGKPVLCEKPLTTLLAETIELVTISNQKNVLLMEAMWTSCMPIIIKLKEAINNNLIGTIKEIKADFGFKANFDESSRLFNKQLGGGSILDVGVYPIFLAVYLLGFPKTFSAKKIVGKTNVDEDAIIQLNYENNVVATLNCSIIQETPKEAIIIGENGIVKIQSPWYKSVQAEIESNDSPKQKIVCKQYAVNGMEYEIEAFIQALKNNKKEVKYMPHQITIDVAKIVENCLQL
jgi:predicted dehydrogenase